MPTKPTPDAPDDLDALRQRVAKMEAEAQARAAQAQLDREARLAAFDATAMETLTARMEAAGAEEAEAQAALHAAVLADPVVDAYVRVVAARNTRRYLDQEMVAAASRVGREHRVIGSYSTAPLTELVAGIVDQEAKARAADVVDAHHAAREAAGAGPEGTPSDYDPDVEETVATTPDGRKVKTIRNLRTGAHAVVDLATGRPYARPAQPAKVDDGVADGAQLDRRATGAGEWWTRGASA